MDNQTIADFLAFKILITSKWIKGVYLVGAAIISLYALSSMLNFDNFPTSLLMGAVSLVVGNVAWRIACEYTILLFSMHDHLVTIAGGSHGEGLRTNLTTSPQGTDNNI